jgi:hypothetical protein
LHEFILTNNGPEVMHSTQSAEAIMSGMPPREANLGATPQSPRVD